MTRQKRLFNLYMTHYTKRILSSIDSLEQTIKPVLNSITDELDNLMLKFGNPEHLPSIQRDVKQIRSDLSHILIDISLLKDSIKELLSNDASILQTLETFRRKLSRLKDRIEVFVDASTRGACGSELDLVGIVGPFGVGDAAPNDKNKSSLNTNIRCIST